VGLGGYLAAKSDGEHYASEAKREEREIEQIPQNEAQEIYDTFSKYGVSEDEASKVVASLEKRPEVWRDFMMKFELGLEKPNPSRALKSALTSAASYVIGGIIPLFPYVVLNDSHQALMLSATVILIALFSFGFIKGHFTGVSKLKSGLQTILAGGLAASAAYALAKAIS